MRESTAQPRSRAWRAVAALAGIGYAIGAACGGGGGGGGFFPVATPFPQAWLPLAFPVAGTAGDVAFALGGDLFVVAGDAALRRVARGDGAQSTLAANVGPGAVLLSVAIRSDGVAFVGDDAGNVHSVDAAGNSALIANTGSQPVTGLAFAPAGFGDFSGSLITASGSDGIFVIKTSEPVAPRPLATPGDIYLDVGFFGATLHALDASNAEIDTVSAAGVVASFQGGFTTPVGLAIDGVSQEILVADAGTDVLRSVDVGGGAPVDLAPYDFDASPPNGIAFDGTGTIAFVTRGSVIVRGAAVPPLNPANFGIPLAGTTAGDGDLELDRIGRILGVGNDPDDPAVVGDSVGNLLFRAERNANSVVALTQNLGAPGEELLGLAFEPVSQHSFIGTSLGNVFRFDGAAVTLLANVSAGEVLGLELAPPGFGVFGGQIVATTDLGEVLAIDIDPATPATVTPIVAPPIETAPGSPSLLSDLVFRSDATLYVIDNGASVAPAQPRVLQVSSAGVVTDLAITDPLGLPEGVTIDEGDNRLLVASVLPAGDRLLEVDLDMAPPTVTALQNLAIQDGYLPSGVVYDGLGRVVVHAGDTLTRLDAFVVFP